MSVYAKIDNEKLCIQSQIYSHKGEMIFNENISGETDDGKNIGRQLGEIAINQLGQDKINELDFFKDDFNYTP